MKPLDYFASHPLFRLENFTAAHQAGERLKPDSSLAAVKQHVRAGNLLRIRRGVYAVVPRGQTRETVGVDPYVLASNLAPDAVVAYHGALQFHGKAHSLTRRVPFLTATKTKPFLFRGAEFVPVPVPAPLRAAAGPGRRRCREAARRRRRSRDHPRARLGRRPRRSPPRRRLGGDLALARVRGVLRPRRGHRLRIQARVGSGRGEGRLLPRAASRGV